MPLNACNMVQPPSAVAMERGIGPKSSCCGFASAARCLSLVVLVLGLPACDSRNQLATTAHQWSCAESICTVSFSITNESPEAVLANYSLRAIQKTWVGKPSAQIFLVVGEYSGAVDMEGKASVHVETALQVKAPPYTIQISSWK